MTFQGCFLPSFDSFGRAVSEEKILEKSANQKQELPMVAMFVNESELNEHFHRGPSKDASYQISIHLAKQFQRRRFFLEINQSETDLPRMLPTKFRFFWPSGYREDSLEINQSETRITCGRHVC
jgi:hypothetical protein